MTSPYPSQGDPYGQQPQYGQQPPPAAGSSYELPGQPVSGYPASQPSGYTDPYAQPADPYAQGYQQPVYQPQPIYQPVPVAVPMPGYSTVGGGYGVDPVTGRPLSDKSKLTAGLLQIFLGGFGVGRFYTGHIGIAVCQLLFGWATCYIWPLVDGIVLLASSNATDAEGRLLRS
ncbi:NINE protein [Phytomonospora sp. NPDC050363]|jgi:hypothetical protein|uniref:TM2 domain-containing protein n=1 Tax=Phytomonospora sp. NPDC050363 TaxID=3155642 RepID=UPI0033F419D6